MKKDQAVLDISALSKTDLTCLAELFEELITSQIKENNKPP